MNIILLPLLAVLSIWDYPARHSTHERLRAQFVTALRSADTTTMEETCRKGVALLPDDPTWHFNLACSLAYFPKRTDEALDELEQAIDLGFRDSEAIAKDNDLKRLAMLPRFKELVEYAKEMQTRPLLTGPLATVDATGIFGTPVALGEQNLQWDFEVGCFKPLLKLAKGREQPWTGDLYMNRDGGHSQMPVAAFPGLTEVKFDMEGRNRNLQLTVPNICFPYPTFGNCSMAHTHPIYWRSIPRSLMTTEVTKLRMMERLYLANQIWVFPSNADTAPVGTNGDVFASITPYWLTTAGRSWSDRPYLRAALYGSAALRREVKQEIVRRGLLAPTLMTLIRKSLGTVRTEDDYISPRAHPTALPPNGVDTNRLVTAAAGLTSAAIPPLAVIRVQLDAPEAEPLWPELTYRTDFACAYVLRTEDAQRTAKIQAGGAKEFRFVVTHGPGNAASIETLAPNVVRVAIDSTKLNPTSRIDIAVFGRNPGTGWGAPSYVSFARMDPAAPYSDPALTPLAPPTAEPVKSK